MTGKVLERSRSNSDKTRDNVKKISGKGEKPQAQRTKTKLAEERGKAGDKTKPKDHSAKISGKSGKVTIPTAGKRQAEVKKKKKPKKVAVEKEAVVTPSKSLNKKRDRSFFAKYCGSTPDVVLRDPRSIEAAQALHLTQKHLKRLRNKFDNIDVDGSGSIDTDEFFETVGETRSPFTDALFALIDMDGSGTIEFEEYIRVLATYCMFTKDEILRFCFECFDKDGSNAIDENEFIELCKTVNNAAPMFPGNFVRALEQFDVNDDGLIDYNEFIEIERRYPLILFPAFKLQDALQRSSLGEREWLRIIEDYNKSKRIEEYKATHGGKLPPDPFFTRISKQLFPCFYQEKIHVTLGADMERRHKSGMVNSPSFKGA